MYAVIATGGKQYKVAEGEKLKVEKITGKIGDEVNFDNVLLVGGDAKPNIGTPLVEGALVSGKVLAQDRARKILVYKKKPKKGYEKRYGHRQPYTEVQITKIKS